MTERWNEERETHSAAFENARRISQARRRAEEELLRAQGELRNQSEWLRVTLASIGDAVITTDTEGNVTSVNRVAEQLTGWPIQDAKGRPLDQVFRIVNEDTREEVESPTERALREGRIVGLANHTLLIARNGHETPIDDSVAPIRDESGRVHGVILIFRSISERKEAEEALRQSERELSDFFENASVAMHWLGPDGKILRVNRAELNMLGYAPEEYLGHHIAEFHVDQDIINDLLARLAAGETVQDCEARMRCKDGSVKHVLIDSSVRWVAGEFVHTRCFTRDITDRKQAELARARLAAIVESSQDAIISKTLEGRIVSWNAGAEHTFGYKAEEAIGRSIMILVPEERHDEERVILERLRRGERIEHYETVRIAKDGRRVDVSLTISPVRDDSGRIIGGSKISRDITARKRAEQRLATQNTVTRYLAESESLESAAPLILQAICENQSWEVGALWCVDDDAQVLRCVDFYHEPSIQVPQFEALSRKTAFRKGKGLPGRIWAENQVACIPDVVRDANFPRVSAAVAEGLHAGFGFPITLRNDVLGVVEFFSFETRQPSQHLLIMMAAIGSQIGQFIERRRAERASAALLATLKETDRRKDEFLAMLAHELRNPLAPIHNAVQIYRRAAPPSRDLNSATDVIDRQVRQLTRLVDDLLDVSRITRGKVELRQEPVELSDVLQSALEASRPLIEKSEHALTIDIPGQPIRLNADPTRLAQVFLNLLNNAAKYTDPGGHICLAAERHGDEVVVRVKDNGIGIPADMLPRVFELFAQVDRSMDRADGGLGIGLTLVERLVAMHGGTVKANSEGPGKGSEFVVRLPLAESLPVPAKEASRPIRPAKRRILVVDDNRDAADSLGLLLQMSGHDVRTARDGLQAVEMAAKFRPDVVLLDIGLPKLNGYETARRIREMEGGQNVLLVALTGWSQDEDRRRSREAGFDHHLNKPVEWSELEQLLASRCLS